MKINLHRRFLWMSKRILYGFLFQLIFCSMLFASTEQNNQADISQVKMQPDTENASEGDVLNESKLSTNYVADVTVTGTVLDETGLPLPGATVSVSGTTSGTITDIDGKFSISVSESAELIFSYIGYEPQRVSVGNQTTINVTLRPDATALDEVIVIGYGTAKRSDLTGSVGSVNAESLRERPSSSLNQALAGRVSGVQVNSNSGRPGGRTTVRIRGFSSINSSNNPLYVIDGVQMPVGTLDQQSSAIDYVNPNDIVSVEVLKDASSTAI